jgi:hypothetical protein
MATKRNGWILVLFMLCGVLIGSILGELLGSAFTADILTKSLRIGTIDDPITLNLLVLDMTLGAVIHINFGTILGIILGILLYKWTVK